MDLLADLAICLRFFSRLPLPANARESALGASGLSRAAPMVPVAGALIGLVPGLVLLVTILMGLPALLAAPLAVATLVAITGALHEDGLADCADGFGGGRSQERKLEIMRDSRIGTFGACAVALSLYLRAMALSLVAMRAPVTAVAVLVAVAALSRTAALLPLALLPSARAEGLGASAGRPSLAGVAVAYSLAIVIALFTLPVHAGAWHVTGAVAASLLVGLAVCWLAKWQIGGQTGDVAGAAQQCAEIAALLAFAAAG